MKKVFLSTALTTKGEIKMEEFKSLTQIKELLAQKGALSILHKTSEGFFELLDLRQRDEGLAMEWYSAFSEDDIKEFKEISSDVSMLGALKLLLSSLPLWGEYEEENEAEEFLEGINDMILEQPNKVMNHLLEAPHYDNYWEGLENAIQTISRQQFYYFWT